MKEKVGVFYIELLRKIYNYTDKGKKPVTHNIAEQIIGGYMIPKYIVKLIVWEFIKGGLLERKGRRGQYLMFNNTKENVRLINLMDNSSQLYKYVGLW